MSYENKIILLGNLVQELLSSLGSNLDGLDATHRDKVVVSAPLPEAVWPDVMVTIAMQPDAPGELKPDSFEIELEIFNATGKSNVSLVWGTFEQCKNWLAVYDP